MLFFIISHSISCFLADETKRYVCCIYKKMIKFDHHTRACFVIYWAMSSDSQLPIGCFLLHLIFHFVWVVTLIIFLKSKKLMKT